ncbi:hypothetical protein N7475_007245 [Penicillium sp. IBT 31633x]|nr:hypothetical protein N7475_007245 [Penicillium sp. IBT 31633x]
MIVSGLVQQVFAILCAFCTVLNAYNLNTQRLESELSPLGVTLDFGFARNWPKAEDFDANPQPPRSWVWSSHLKFEKEVSEITDGQLWQIALDAYNEIPKDMTYYGIRKGAMPNAMAALAWGNEIILASSHKGEHFLYSLSDTPVSKALELCQIIWRDSSASTEENQDARHKNQGHCGELMAAHLYSLQNDDALSTKNARIATIVFKKPTPPCGNRKGVSGTDCPFVQKITSLELTYLQKDTWGCNLAVRAMGLTEVSIDVALEAYDLKTLAGGNVRNQIHLCSASGSLNR